MIKFPRLDCGGDVYLNPEYMSSIKPVRYGIMDGSVVYMANGAEYFLHMPPDDVAKTINDWCASQGTHG